MRPNPNQTPPTEHDPRRRTLVRGAVLALLGGAVAGLGGCGGGGSDVPDASATAGPDKRKQLLGGVDSGGTGAELFMSAAFDLVAPLTVNGLRLDTTVASISDADGQTLTAEALAPGMCGRIRASRRGQVDGQPSATAWSIEVSEQLLGPVAEVDLAAQGLRMLGLWVAITPRTLFDANLPQGLRSVHSGGPLQVWGELDPVAGRVYATRVAEVAAPESCVLRGVLTHIDRAAGQARIGTWDLVFDANDTADISVGLAAGTVVRARLALEGNGHRLIALRDDALRLPDQAEAEVHGRVTRIDSPLRFAVDGVEVDIAGVRHAQGLSALALGARAEVHGRSVGGLLRATSLALEAEEPVELAGVVSAVRLGEQSFVLRGTTVSWSAATRFEGGSVRLLTVNRRVEVLGRWSADRQRLEASRIHIEA